MPELDYMVLADYVRQDNGVIHIMGAGVDTVATPAVPTAQPLGVALRMSFDTTEQPGESHQPEGIVHRPGQADSSMCPQRSSLPPGHQMFLNTGRPDLAWPSSSPCLLPQYGDYSCELDIDGGAITKAYEFRVIRRAALRRK